MKNYLKKQMLFAVICSLACASKALLSMNEENWLMFSKLDFNAKKQFKDIENSLDEKTQNRLNTMVIRWLTNGEQEEESTHNLITTEEKSESTLQPQKPAETIQSLEPQEEKIESTIQSKESVILSESDLLAINIISTLTIEKLNDLTESDIKEILSGSTVVAAHFIKQIGLLYKNIEKQNVSEKDIYNRQMNYFKKLFDDFCFKYINLNDLIKITKAHPECAESFLIFGHSNDFLHIQQNENHKDLRKTFIDAVNQDNLARVSHNLFWLINHSNDTIVAQKIALSINAKNILDIKNLLLIYLLKVDASTAPIIAKNAITSENINETGRKHNDIFWWNNARDQEQRYVSIIDKLIQTDKTCARIIFENAITKDNFEVNKSIINDLVRRDKTLENDVHEFNKNAEKAEEIIKRQIKPFINGYCIVNARKNLMNPSHALDKHMRNYLEDEYIKTFKKYYNPFHEKISIKNPYDITQHNAYAILGVKYFDPEFFSPILLRQEIDNNFETKVLRYHNATQSWNRNEKSFIEKSLIGEEKLYLFKTDEINESYIRYTQESIEKDMVSVIVAYDVLTHNQSSPLKSKL